MSIRDFNPINGNGKRMPTAKAREQLYQLYVETRDGEQIAIAPRMSRRALEPLMERINVEIISGREKAWSNPCLVPVKPL